MPPISPTPLPDRKIDLPGEQNHEHPERERADDGELDDELREIARPEERRLLHREKRGGARERERHGEVLEQSPDSN